MRPCDDWFVFHIEPDGRSQVAYLDDIKDDPELSREMLSEFETMKGHQLYKTPNGHYYFKYVTDAMHRDVFDEDTARAIDFIYNRVDEDMQNILWEKYRGTEAR